jgi:hypothetical protein
MRVFNLKTENNIKTLSLPKKINQQFVGHNARAESAQ